MRDNGRRLPKAPPDAEMSQLHEPQAGGDSRSLPAGRPKGEQTPPDTRGRAKRGTKEYATRAMSPWETGSGPGDQPSFAIRWVRRDTFRLAVFL
jgi:hypothetical protein